MAAPPADPATPPARPRDAADDVPARLGLRLAPGGARAAVRARWADGVDLCLVDEAGAEQRRVPLHRSPGGLWTADVPGAGAGQRYGYRVHGPWDPAAGHRHDASKLLLDPHALAVDGELAWGPALFSHAVQGPQWRPAPGPPPHLDSAGAVPLGVLVEAPVAEAAARPRTPWAETVVYEAHLRGLTRAHPAVPPAQRGTWAGLAHPAVLEHLVGLGVTAVELLPVQAAATEVPLARRGRTNAWGYSTLSWTAPDPRFATAAARAAGPAAVLAEVAGAVAALHAAGLEVLLDVVLNHSCEGAAGDGPTLSLRGLDAATHYRLDAAGRDVDATGCGNTLDFGEPGVVELALDSLRHWVGAFGVDGFRFDLAPALARGRDGAWSPDHPFLVAAGADPVLRDVKLVAEPWDLGPGGWRTGEFPAPFADWNDRFRGDAREFWLAGPGRLSRGQAPGAGLRRLARRTTGSADLFGTGARGTERGPLGGVSFVTAHDGFTLADLTAFDRKHNEAHGEDGRDGSDDNRSWNHGVEGWVARDGRGSAQARELEARRRRSVRNLLATLLTSAGVPMLLAGDETGRTQGGDNNAYCVDDETTWVSWDLAPWQEDLLATARWLLALRREHAVLRPALTHAFPGEGHPAAPTAVWFDPSGRVTSGALWADDAHRTTAVLLAPGAGAGARERRGSSLLLVLHGQLTDAPLVLPPLPAGTAGAAPGGAAPDGPAADRPAADRATGRGYRLLWDSADERPLPAPDPEVLAPGGRVQLSALSTRIYEVVPAPGAVSSPAGPCGAR